MICILTLFDNPSVTSHVSVLNERKFKMNRFSRINNTIRLEHGLSLNLRVNLHILFLVASAKLSATPNAEFGCLMLLYIVAHRISAVTSDRVYNAMQPQARETKGA